MQRYLRAAEESGMNEPLKGLAESIETRSFDGRELTAADGNRRYAAPRSPKGRYENLVQPGYDVYT
jgi:hypothetical protein